ncbi:MAG TPA: pyruvate, phosphate dikinase [Verrucomicrobiota bacterium]|jgi:pyruvate,orthophosphate dikinase|nr:pyruvate, phosphate dikinase [Verrucomicrobiota bacterium]OQC65325.1 MAG: Pyruvate, phosphate dikinase [Verrucomicrobia bacterium ADurb.Bin006]HNU99150.1 pyruvate, phosphate dikinase [Verrucomicrobiota bacterium]HOA60997.1 pyruvate, phosphate dikinase [Verrucomicrobiota bacterium]HOF48637.1 pyruvate, phosphate dikinase [Verrucomicrobiota bacterium]
MPKALKSQKHVYLFGNKKADGDGSMKPLLGGKGANLAEMSRIGLPVPPGFTITTEVCNYYYANKRTYPKQLQAQIKNGIEFIEKIMGTKFNDQTAMPLLVSVRSGARDSMPGMMDTILNLGLNDRTVVALVNATKNERFAWDCYRRFVQMYGDVVMGVQKRPNEDHEPFEVVIHELKHERYAQDIEDTRLTVDDLKELVKRFQVLIKDRTGGKEFPQDPWKQLEGAVGAVFGSWMNDRAIVYRRKYNIPSEWGTAVNVQAMVYGNTGNTSGSGVAFTRNPANGAKEFYGEFLINAQGEDVVAGVRTPEPVAQLAKEMPAAYKELDNIRTTLERHFKDVQDFEFTIQDGKVFMLQTRNGKRTAMAALKFSMDMVKEKLITWETAVLRNPADQLDQLLAPIFDAKAEKAAKVIATGLPAGPGAASGKLYLNADRADAAAARGEKVLLVRNETSPEDLRGMIASEGILTAKGGVSSHAALVARQMGKVCVCGAAALQIDYNAKTVTAGGQTFTEGDYLSINGTVGNVYVGQIPTAPSEIVQVLVDQTLDPKKSETYAMFKTLMDWCAKATRMQVRTNADTPEQAENAIAFGATGIGLTRTEHMFFEGDRIKAMREMILADNVADRKEALAKLLPYQKEDFVGIFRALKGFPATIRFLDPPLHEFLPHDDNPKGQQEIADEMDIPVEKIRQRVKELHEFNPMLGFRGCRLGIVYPEISEMQARAVFEAAAEVQKSGIKVKPEVMIPLVGFKRELDLQAEVVHRVAKEVMAEQKVRFNYSVGTMIEIPRGALTADEIAQTAEFFSFGTNDLTQTCLGMSRDDSASFLGPYTEAEVVNKNPFASIDQTGVGQLVKIAVEKGRSTRPGIKLGICGEHGGDPDSVKFCHRVGLTYVSCSPFRVPVARLAAAQAAIAEKQAAGAKTPAKKTAKKSRK